MKDQEPEITSDFEIVVSVLRFVIQNIDSNIDQKIVDDFYEKVAYLLSQKRHDVKINLPDWIIRNDAGGINQYLSLRCDVTFSETPSDDMTNHLSSGQ